MRALLMHADRDFDATRALPRHEPELTQDLALDTLLRAMAGDDAFVLAVARTALLTGFENDVETVRYRQDVLRDCSNNAAVVREIYGLATEAVREEKRHYFVGGYRRSSSGTLYTAVGVLEMLVGVLGRLRQVVGTHAGRFESRGLTALFATLQQELGDEYFASLQQHLTTLKFRHGTLLSARLGAGGAGRDYVLRRARDARPRWLSWMLGAREPAYTFEIAERDYAGAQALSELHNRGVNLVANAVAQSAEHVVNFFTMLRTELAFYVACLNLRDRLAALGAPICVPRPAPVGARTLRFDGLYDVCLSLSAERRVVGNVVDADGKRLLLVTGANQGGKSTFLRSVGLAQLMMQCGLFVGADAFAGELCTGLFTHYKREEDPSMRQGKFDEELSRLSDIVDALTPDAVVLFNESFAATNEIEGSEIARQVVRALVEKRVKVVFVTHLFEFARGLFDSQIAEALFLRAERQPDGTRTFRLVEAEPLETSYGEDLYHEVFETTAVARGDG